MEKSSDMKTVKYKCEQCGAEDENSYFPNEAPRGVVDCYSCHAGQGKSTQDQFLKREGMFPV